ncbi:MAG: DUF4224 domain-containing protein [Burkholderiales bacterium]|nr:DUF4224 domain-containing protein [Burkholderiales bacterium]
MSQFLDKQDLIELTGCKRKSDQVEWLRSQGIMFYVNKAGRPAVPKSAVNGGETKSANDEWEPGVVRR